MHTDKKLLHYSLVEKIGEGGMGVIWKAVDTTLGREVAIKILPEHVAQDAERLARFEREAKLLASLNHPNIATIHGFHQCEGMHFLAMELVEGEDLADLLKRGPLEIGEALGVARQIAAALEAAHVQGVIHRDLKPANVVLTPDGKAKVLDFGLAKAVESAAASGSGSLSLSPTITSMGTVAGMILGTAAYMSPEQARGKPVDRRADLWSFGCVLYECLTGKQLFRGETVSDSLAAILRKEPDWSELPDGTPPLIRLLLRRSLTRDRGQRLQDAGDARIELEQAIEDPHGASFGLATGNEAPVSAARTTGWLPWAVALSALLLAVFLGIRGNSPEPSPVRRLAIPLPGITEFGDNSASPPVVSPDGRAVLFGGPDESGGISLWLRPLDSFIAQPLANTDGAEFAFWSPDSRHVGFFSGGTIQLLELATGRMQTLGNADVTVARGGSWNADGMILFSPNSNAGIHVIDAAGGAVRQVTYPDPDVRDSSHRWPFFLPDGEHFLFVSWTNDLGSRQEHGGVFVASLSGDEEPQRVLPDASKAVYVPPGYLLAIRGDNLVATPFDAGERRVTGDAMVVTSGVYSNRMTAHAAISGSNDDTLVYAPGSALRSSTLAWYDRNGTSTETGGEPAPIYHLRLSPDATRAAVVIIANSGDGEIWIVDLIRGIRTRLAADSWTYDDALWSAAGDRLLFTSMEKGTLDLFTTLADGSSEQQPFLLDGNDKDLYDWSVDGKYVAYGPVDGIPGIWIYYVESQRSEAIISGDTVYTEARFSHDGKWIAYVSDESGREEVFVQSFSTEGSVKLGRRWQVSTSGGTGAHWRDDGREIVYLSPEGQVMAVAIDLGAGSLELGVPRELFTIDGVMVAADATGDHQRFLIATRDALATQPIHVVLNWLSDLE
jgi:serine/threonine protein kinase/Tol biopolymer transport system component